MTGEESNFNAREVPLPEAMRPLCQALHDAERDVAAHAALDSDVISSLAKAEVTPETRKALATMIADALERVTVVFTATAAALRAKDVPNDLLYALTATALHRVGPVISHIVVTIRATDELADRARRGGEAK